MICPNCNGTGEKGRTEELIAVCSHCNGTGEVQTNEEWLNGLSFDSKAYWLANTCRRATWENKYDNNEEKETFGYWKKWLKEKHT